MTKPSESQQSSCIHFCFFTHVVDKPSHSSPNTTSKWRQHKLPCQPHWYWSKVFFFILLLPKTFNPSVIPCISSNGSAQILTPVLQAKITGLETGLLCIIISPQCFGIICEGTWGWIYTTCHREEKPLWISGKDANISFSPSQLQHNLSGWGKKTF